MASSPESQANFHLHMQEPQIRNHHQRKLGYYLLWAPYRPAADHAKIDKSQNGATAHEIVSEPRVIARGIPILFLRSQCECAGCGEAAFARRGSKRSQDACSLVEQLELELEQWSSCHFSPQGRRRTLQMEYDRVVTAKK